MKQNLEVTSEAYWLSMAIRLYAAVWDFCSIWTSSAINFIAAFFCAQCPDSW